MFCLVKMMTDCQTAWTRVNRQELLGDSSSTICLYIWHTAPNCIKDFLDLQGDFSQSGLTLQLFQMVILANQV